MRILQFWGRKSHENKRQEKTCSYKKQNEFYLKLFWIKLNFRTVGIFKMGSIQLSCVVHWFFFLVQELFLTTAAGWPHLLDFLILSSLISKFQVNLKKLKRKKSSKYSLYISFKHPTNENIIHYFIILMES